MIRKLILIIVALFVFIAADSSQTPCNIMNLSGVYYWSGCGESRESIVKGGGCPYQLVCKNAAAFNLSVKTNADSCKAQGKTFAIWLEIDNTPTPVTNTALIKNWVIASKDMINNVLKTQGLDSATIEASMYKIIESSKIISN
jgi:hypothetical protein